MQEIWKTDKYSEKSLEKGFRAPDCVRRESESISGQCAGKYGQGVKSRSLQTEMCVFFYGIYMYRDAGD